MSQILLLNSEQGTVAILTKLLKTEGFSVKSVNDPVKARELLTSEQFNMVITSAGGTWDSDLEILKLARTKLPAMPAVVIMENTNETLASQISELGVFETITKPLKVDFLLATVQKAIDYNDAAILDGVNLNLKLETVYQLANIVAESPVMRSVCDMASRIAATDVIVLIVGDSGVGKAAMARAIHDNSRRKDGKFVSVDCSDPGIESSLFGDNSRQGAFLEASGGTLLLEKISQLPRQIQKKLLLALQEKKIQGSDKKPVPVNVRLIVSTRDDLDKLIKGGMFSSELYKILKLIQIKIPPLAVRPDDIMPTFRKVLQRKVKSGALPALDQEVAEIVRRYSWPRNIDEMEEVVEHVLKFVKDNKITKACLPKEILEN
ncbi:MAG: sigma-54-dependent Fis family transcriptional regulator [Lentisphaerae bacterium]|nr:sigma-54-dependent Fis family transcriptional regulator [Lentisphaerota bacterium]